MHVRVVSALVVASLCGACDAPAGDTSADVTLRKKQLNGPVNNGSTLNGITLNGITLNGTAVNGITLNGITLNGTAVNGITLNGTQFAGTQWVDGVEEPRSGVDFIGAQFRVYYDGTIYVMQFNDIYKNPADPDGDVYFYDIEVFDPNEGSWTPLCKKDDQPTTAIPLGALWDPDSGNRLDKPTALTFACRGFVLAKCVEFGYRPWATATRCDGPNGCESVPLADYHQACTRMIRADYCGDGSPHTINGTLIDIYDPLSPQLQVRSTADKPNWGVEAEWGPDGALCVGDSLRLQLLDDLGIGYKEPECLAGLDLPDCGEMTASRGAMIGNSYCTQWGTNPGACS